VKHSRLGEVHAVSAREATESHAKEQDRKHEAAFSALQEEEERHAAEEAEREVAREAAQIEVYHAQIRANRWASLDCAPTPKGMSGLSAANGAAGCVEVDEIERLWEEEVTIQI